MSAPTKTKTKAKLNPRHIVEVDGERRELKMSFGLLNELVALVGSAAYVGTIPVDAELGKAVLSTVLAKRDNTGTVVEELNLFETNITPEQTMALYQWVMGHVLDFFLAALETAATVGSQFNQRLEALFPPSPSGSALSLSETQSAGPAV